MRAKGEALGAQTSVAAETIMPHDNAKVSINDSGESVRVGNGREKICTETSSGITNPRAVFLFDFSASFWP